MHQCLDIADQLIDLEVGLVVLTGGEPVLYQGWDRIAKRLSHCGVPVRLFTSGSPFDEETLKRALDAGIGQFAVSLDGPRNVHDHIRKGIHTGIDSPFSNAMNALEQITRTEAKVRVVTQVNKRNIDHLFATYKLVSTLAIERWQIHLCQATGRAKDHMGEMILPEDLEKIARILLVAAQERKVVASMHCTVGYNIPEETVLRSREAPGRAVWLGCVAGKGTVSITNDGRVKGCTALPDEFSTGNLTSERLADIWADDERFPYTRLWSSDVLTGACKACSLSKTCKAGCPAVAYGATGTIGLNPYCLRTVRGN